MSETAGLRPTISVEHLLESESESAPKPSGAVIADILNTHDRYVDKGIAWDDMATVGPLRTVAEHVRVASQRWDPAKAPVLSGQFVILGLALDEGIAWPMLRSGVIASMLARWTPGRGTAEEPYRLVWDLLSKEGSVLCEEQPLIAAAFGAPAEWSVELPDKPRALCWSPLGDHVAVLAGGSLYETGPGRPLRRTGAVNPAITSLGWGHDGPVGLTATDGTVEVTRLSSLVSVGTARASGGRLSGDGTCVWIETTDGVRRWAPPKSPADESLADAGPLAVDGTGRRGIAFVGNTPAVVGDPPGPASGAAMTVPLSSVAGASALARIGDQLGVVTASNPGALVGLVSGPIVARLATGADQVTALATDISGRRLVVATDHRLSAWTLATRRPSADGLPGFDSDRTSGVDLLDADRDARALGALIASRELKPPLTVGLFGAWGSGKSFLLGRIEQVLSQLSTAGAAAGYHEHVKVVEFNAWQYAETNLWASLVDKVLREIGLPAPEQPDPAMAAAEQRASAARAAVEAAAAQVEAAANELAAAQRRLDRRRRNAWLLGGGLLLLVAVAIVAVMLGGVGRVVAWISTVLALLGAATGALAKARSSAAQARDLAGAGRSGVAVLNQLMGRGEGIAVRAADMKLTQVMADQQRAAADADALERAALEARSEAHSRPLETVLERLSTVTEYRDELGLVARTRERFASIDQAVAEAQENRAQGREGGIMLDRVVIVIDDLDRCPAEKVVTVLEAVHLLFDFSMFVVVMAVDTRWLDQSLRIRYRQLLGRAGSASPSDYLEKIIQVPMQLLPLDESLVRKLITGLTGVAADSTPAASAIPRATHHESGDLAKLSLNGPPHPTRKRAERGPLPARVLEISEAEASALAAVAPLVGRTPRTVKRFVNTYRLLKARTADPTEFDQVDGPIGDHEAVAFLLAVLVGRPETARILFTALAHSIERGTLGSLITSLPLRPDPSPIADLAAWISEHPRYGQAPVRSLAKWAEEVARFSFTSPVSPSGSS